MRTLEIISVARFLSDRINFNLIDLLALGSKLEASDLHIKPGLAPVFRINGTLFKTDLHPLLPDYIENLLQEVVPPEKFSRIKGEMEIDFAYEIPNHGRYRGNIFLESKGMGASFRIIKTEIPDFNKLGLPLVMAEFARLDQGLVLVTGPTGSGKSTTLAAMVQYINENFPKHIISIEDPIEFQYQPSRSIISQRQLNQHCLSFSGALRAALREDPDVILVGEMRDTETISLAITAAETGHLVLSTLHTNSAVKTIDRIIDAFPRNQATQIQNQLAELLQAVVSQRLVQSVSGSERLLALEIMRLNPAVRNLIREGKTHQILSIMQTSREAGMCTLDNSLLKLVQNKRIKMRDAQEVALEKKQFDGPEMSGSF